MYDLDKSDLYEVLLSDGSTLRVERTHHYGLNEADVSVSIYKEDDLSQKELYNEFLEITSEDDILDWVESQGFSFANDAARFIAGEIIRWSIISNECSVEDSLMDAIRSYK